MSDIDLGSKLARLANTDSDVKSLLQGSKGRAAATSSGTWGRQLDDLKKAYMQAIVDEAVSIIKDEGGKAKGKAGVFGEVQGTDANGQELRVNWRWAAPAILTSSMYLGEEKSVGQHHEILSLSPKMVASESLYKHYLGLLP